VFHVCYMACAGVCADGAFLKNIHVSHKSRKHNTERFPDCQQLKLKICSDETFTMIVYITTNGVLHQNFSEI